jgi:hypothetical protein
LNATIVSAVIFYRTKKNAMSLSKDIKWYRMKRMTDLEDQTKRRADMKDELIYGSYDANWRRFALSDWIGYLISGDQPSIAKHAFVQHQYLDVERLPCSIRVTTAEASDGGGGHVSGPAQRSEKYKFIGRKQGNRIHCERASNNNTILNHSQSMARSIEAIAQWVPATPEEKGDTTSGDAATIDGLKVASNKDG